MYKKREKVLPPESPLVRKYQRRRLAHVFSEKSDIKRAAAVVGIDRDTATQMLKHPEVIKIIEEGLSEAAQRANISRQWVLERLREIVERCMAPDDFDASGASRALELIGKHLKLFGDDTAAAQLGTSVLKLLAQEAQAGRIPQPSVDAVLAEPTAPERVPSTDGHNVLAPGMADAPGDQPLSPPQSSPPTPSMP